MDGKSLERRVMKGRSKKEEARSDEAEGSYEHCLKQERDRERKWRMSRQGAFEFSFSSLDEMTGSFGDPSKIALFSDHSRGAAVISRESKKDILAEAMSLLVKHDDQLAAKESPKTRKKKKPKRERQRAKDFAFIKAVIEGKSWEDLGMPKATFFRWLKKVESKVRHHPPKRSLSDVRGRVVPTPTPGL